MRRFALSLPLVAAVAAMLPASLLASSSNPPDLYLVSGAIRAVSCTACHLGNQRSTGALSLSGLPAKFEPGKAYPLTVKVSEAGAKKAGFRLAAQFASGEQAGTIVNRDPGCDVHVAAGVTFLKQSYNGVDTNGAGRSWSFIWKAPATGGKVIFSVEGAACDADGTVRNDHCYTSQATVDADARAVARNTAD